jgi:transcriptional regulator with XRE-family HTH domain
MKNGPFPNCIRSLRRSSGLTLKELAGRVGCSLNHIGLLERGERPLSLPWMKKIANALGVETVALLLDEDNPNRLSPEEMDLIARFRMGDDERKSQLIRIAEILVPSESPTFRSPLKLVNDFASQGASQ